MKHLKDFTIGKFEIQVYDEDGKFVVDLKNYSGVLIDGVYGLDSWEEVAGAAFKMINSKLNISLFL